MMFPLVQELAAEKVPVRLICGTLGFSPQAYYKWRVGPISDRDWHDAHTINALVDAHRDDPEFGYRFLADELASSGQVTGERRVWRLCSQQKLWSTTTRKGRRGAGKTPGPAVHDDLVERRFSAAAPNLLWLTDITEHPTAEGKLYCCAIKDCFSNRIVGYALGDRMTAQLATQALKSAIARRQPLATVVVHSDRGSQGGFNRSSQHLDSGGGERWRRRTGAGRPAMSRRVRVGSGVRIGRFGRRCARPGGLIHRGWCSGSSGG
jgi:transposase InsO family protein